MPVGDASRSASRRAATRRASTRSSSTSSRQTAVRSTGELGAHARRELVARIASGGSVVALAAETGWSERHLLRRSRELFGYGPTVLRRVLRLQRALGAARSGRPLAQVAFDVGYSDQAHLSRDVRALTGATISALTG